jgi:hypothetical protein
MYANYKITTQTLVNASASTINIPINIEYQIVDNSELIERVFVDIEEQKAVNQILDYDKARFLPVYDTVTPVNKIIYNVNLLNENGNMMIPTYYSNIGIDDGDIKLKKNFFTEGYLLLSFFDSDNQLTQNLVSQIEIYNHLSKSDYHTTTTLTQIAGQPKPSNMIPVHLTVSNPLTDFNGYYVGYHIYAYKDLFLNNNVPVSLYMRATYVNAKTGKATNMMTENAKYSIDKVIYKRYTKFNLFKISNGYYYTVDTTYSNNVLYNNTSNPNQKDLIINLYQIQSL